jgi:hypothetical protein
MGARGASRRSTCRRASFWPARRRRRRARCRSSFGSTRARCSSVPEATELTGEARGRPRRGRRRGPRAPSTTRDADAVLDASSAPARRGRRARPGGARAAARCLATARACEPGRPLPVARLVLRLGDTLVLDEATQRHLELVRSVDGESAARSSRRSTRRRRRRGAAPAPSAARSARRVAEIRRRLDAVELFVVQPGCGARCASASPRWRRRAARVKLASSAPRRAISSRLRRSLAELPTLADALEAAPIRRRARRSASPPASRGSTRAPTHELLARALADDPPARASDGGSSATASTPISTRRAS